MVQPKKIIYVITKSNWGGAQKYVFELCTSLPPKQFAVSVIYGGEGALADKLAAAGVPTHSISGLWRDISLWSDFKAWWRLVEIFKREKPDIVHLNSSKIGGLGALAARLAGVPKIIFTIHGWAFDEDRPWWQKWLIKFTSWLTLILVTDTIAISKHSQNQVGHWPLGVAQKIKLIYNGINTTEPIRYKTRADLRIATDHIIIGAIGELTKNKGLWYAIKAMRELKNRKIVMLIIGDGEEREVLEGLIAKENVGEKVSLLGHKDHAAEWLQIFDIFILPSIKEGLPYVLLEAGLAKRPVIATDVGSVGEIISDDNTGLLVPPRDVEALAEAIDSLAGNAPKRTILGTDLELLVKEKFAKEKMLNQTIALYLN